MEVLLEVLEALLLRHADALLLAGWLRWREADEKERLWNLQPSHPLLAGIPEQFELEREEMYGERFDVPEPDDRGVPRGFATASRKIELYSEMLAEHGYPPLPEFDEPRISPRSRPDLAQRFPLVLTCAKSLWFCETQHRNVASLRRAAPEPQLEIHPGTADARGIAAGDWVRLETPYGSVRARARFNTSLDPHVVCGQHGWWQACDELDLPAVDPFGSDSTNLNLVLRQRPSDPISGSSPLRASSSWARDCASRVCASSSALRCSSWPTRPWSSALRTSMSPLLPSNSPRRAVSPSQPRGPSGCPRPS